MFIDLLIKQAPGAWFLPFSIPLVLSNVGNDLVIKAGLACILGIEGTVGIEIGPLNVQSHPLDVLEG